MPFQYSQLSPGFASLLEHEILAPALEAKLGRKALKGCEASANRLVLANIKLVVHLAFRKFRGSSASIDDLVAAGISGLSTAARSFDPARGRFPSYARFYIVTAFQKHISEYCMGVARLPAPVSQELIKLSKTRQVLREELGRDPTEVELARELGVKPARIIGLNAVNSPVNLDASVNGAEGEFSNLHDIVEGGPSTLQELGFAADAELLAHLMESLAPRERDILALRFGIGDEPRTLEFIAKKYEVTRERIRQIEFIALRTLRAAAKRMPELRGRNKLAA